MFRSVTAAAALLALVGLALPASASEAVKASNAPKATVKPIQHAQAQHAQLQTVQTPRAATTPSVATPAATPAAGAVAKPGDVKATKDEKAKTPAIGAPAAPATGATAPTK